MRTLARLTLLSVAVPLMLSAVSARAEEGGQDGGGMPPPAMVGVAQPIKKSMIEYDEYTGRFEAVERVELRAQVSGYLREVNFKDGDIVAKGAVLFRIDPRPAESALAQAKANLGSAEAAAALAKIELDRAGRLSKGVTISAAELDAKTQAMAQAAAAVEASRAAVDTAALNLSYTTITAPIGGRVSDAGVTVGNNVRAGDTVLTTIVSLDPIRFVFSADEAAYLKYTRYVAKGERESSRTTSIPVAVGLMDETGFPHKGHMDFVDNAMDESTGTIRGRAIFDNKAGLFIPGLFGRIQLPVREPYEALLIPEQALVSNAQGKAVMVVGEGNVIAPRPIVVGIQQNGWRVVEEGLTTADTIVVSGTNKAIPGLPVSPAPATIDPATGAVTVAPPPAPGAPPAPAGDAPAAQPSAEPAKDTATAKP